MHTNEDLLVDFGLEIGEVQVETVKEFHQSRYLVQTLEHILHGN